MYKKLNITENSLKILSLFTNDFNSEYYIREVEKLVGVSPRTAQLILEDLEDKGILVGKLKGKIKLYKLQLSESTKRYLVFVEQYKTLSFLEENQLIKEVIEKIIPQIKGIGLIFGSYAKGLQQKSSDLDIFIVGHYNTSEIEKVSKSLRIDISIKTYPMNIVKKNKNKDIFLKEILKNHLVFCDSENFINMVLTDE